MRAMRENLLPCVEQNPPRPADASVIWMHGLGADGHDFAPIPPELGLPEDLAVRYVFPHAPRIPVTINMGMVMPAWYDITQLDLTGRGHDETGIRRSDAQIRALIDREIERGVPARRIVLAGFSQGGAMALHTGLRHPEPLAGVMVLSAYLLLADKLDDEAHQANRRTSIFQAHGSLDPMVPVTAGRASYERLKEAGHPVEWHEYPMQHQICVPEIRDIGAWLSRVLRDAEAEKGA